MCPHDFLKSQFEIIVTMEGTTPETGNTIMARTSYLPNEILWGHRFENATVAYDAESGSYSIQHNLINKTVLDATPRCSARTLARRMKREKAAGAAGAASGSAASSSSTSGSRKGDAGSDSD